MHASSCLGQQQLSNNSLMIVLRADGGPDAALNAATSVWCLRDSAPVPKRCRGCLRPGDLPGWAC